MADIAELIVALKLQDGVSSGLGRLNGQLKGMGGGLSQVGKGIGQVGAGLGTIATRGAIAAGGALAYVVKQAADFEDAFSGVVKTVEASDAQLQGLNETIRAMAREIPIEATELARLGEAAGALGVDFEDIDEFIRTTALLGVTTDVTSDAAATALGKLGNQLDLTGDDYERFADILVNLGNKGASTEAEILGFAERIAAAGNQADFTTEDILGFASAMASVGLEAEAGGTAFSLLLNNLTTSIATGSDEVEAFAAASDLSVDSFVKSFKTDASGAVQTFLKQLGKLDRFEAAKVLADAGITGARQVDAVLRLAQNYDVLSASLDTAASSTKGLSIEAEKKFDTVASKLKVLKQNLDDAAITIGNEVLPIVADLATEFVGFLNTPGAQKGIRDFAQSLAGGIRDLSREIRGTDFGPLIDTMKGAAAIAKGAFDAFRSLPAPIQQLALAAIVANKVTGGAVGQIAGGLANILTGGLKIALSLRGSSPANPMWVQSVGGGLGGPGGVPAAGGKGGGLLGNAWKLLPPLAAAGIAAEFSDEIIGFGTGLRADLAKSLNIDVPTFSAGDLDWPFGTRNTPTILPGFLFGPNGILGGTPAARVPGTGSFSAPGAVPRSGSRSAGARDLAAQDRTYQAEDRRPTTAVLPDTAMAPVVEGLKDINTSLESQSPTRELLDVALAPIIKILYTINTSLERDRDPEADPKAGNFVPTVKLDPSQVTDLRGTPWARTGPRVPGTGSFTLPGTALSPVTASVNRATAELVRNRTETSTRLLALSGNYAGTNARLDRSNASLATIATKNFSPVINLTNSIRLSPTVIQQRIVQQNVISGFTSNDNSAGI